MRYTFREIESAQFEWSHLELLTPGVELFFTIDRRRFNFNEAYIRVYPYVSAPASRFEVWLPGIDGNDLMTFYIHTELTLSYSINTNHFRTDEFLNHDTPILFCRLKEILQMRFVEEQWGLNDQVYTIVCQGYTQDGNPSRFDKCVKEVQPHRFYHPKLQLLSFKTYEPLLP